MPQLVLDFSPKIKNKKTKILSINNNKNCLDTEEARKRGIRAIRKAQEAFKGVAEKLGIKNDDDVQALVNEVRYGTLYKN